MKRVALTTALALLLLVLGTLACQSYNTVYHAERVEADRLAVTALADALNENRRDRLEAAFDVVSERAKSGELSIVALDVLGNRTRASVCDGVLTDAEADHLLALLADIPEWDDATHPLRYLGMR